MWYLYSLLFGYVVGALLVGKIVNQAERNGTSLTDAQTCFVGIAMLLLFSIPLLNVIFGIDTICSFIFGSHELENKIDEYQEELEPITTFLIPGSSKINALCNVVRTICRRTERQIYHIELLPCQLSASAYINRLSDYFFVLGRKF